MAAWRPPQPRRAAGHVRGAAGHLLLAAVTLLVLRGPAPPPRGWGLEAGAMSRGFPHPIPRHRRGDTCAYRRR